MVGHLLSSRALVPPSTLQAYTALGSLPSPCHTPVGTPLLAPDPEAGASVLHITPCWVWWLTQSHISALEGGDRICTGLDQRDPHSKFYVCLFLAV